MKKLPKVDNVKAPVNKNNTYFNNYIVVFIIYNNYWYYHICGNFLKDAKFYGFCNDLSFILTYVH